jgi:hypothetical protein
LAGRSYGSGNSVVRQSVILVASRGRRRRWLILPPAAVPQPDYPLRGCHWRPHLATVDRSTEVQRAQIGQEKSSPSRSAHARGPKIWPKPNQACSQPSRPRAHARTHGAARGGAGRLGQQALACGPTLHIAAARTMRVLLRVVAAAQLCQSSGAQCLSDAELARVADLAQEALESGGGPSPSPPSPSQRYNVTRKGALGAFDFSFAPANYTHSGVNPSSRYIVPRLGPWREGDLGGESFLNWGIGEVTTMTSRMAVVAVICTPPPVLLWSLEAAVLYRLNLSTSISPGASISNTENSATQPGARCAGSAWLAWRPAVAYSIISLTAFLGVPWCCI